MNITDSKYFFTLILITLCVLIGIGAFGALKFASDSNSNPNEEADCQDYVAGPRWPCEKPRKLVVEHMVAICRCPAKP